MFVSHASRILKSRGQRPYGCPAFHSIKLTGKFKLSCHGNKNRLSLCFGFPTECVKVYQTETLTPYRSKRAFEISFSDFGGVSSSSTVTWSARKLSMKNTAKAMESVSERDGALPARYMIALVSLEEND